MFQRLPIALAQVKAEILADEIRQIKYSQYGAKVIA